VSIQTIILDDRPDFLHSADGASLLSLPCGAGTLLSEIVEEVESAGGDHICVIPPAGMGDEYRRHLDRACGHDVEIVDRDDTASLLTTCDAADRVLMIDARFRPTDGVRMEDLFRYASDHRWVLHAVAMGHVEQGAREMVHLDEHGSVRGVRRAYQDVNYARVEAVAYSLVPALMLDGLTIESLEELRFSLVRRGSLSRDVPLRGDVWNLKLESGYLGMAEDRLVQLIKNGRRLSKRGYAERMPGVFVGPGCEIDDRARLLGPLVLQDHVVVQAGARVIGPSVIGSGSELASGSLVAQSIVGRGVTISGDTSIRHRVTPDGRSREPMVETGVAKFAAGNASSLMEANDGASSTRNAGSEFRKRTTAGLPSLKRVFDLTAALIGVIVTSPILLLSAVLIRLESRGPIFFGHEREGLDGKVFRCLKFRTMFDGADSQQKHLRAANANSVDGPQFKLDNDPRVTRVGRFLRTTNIDELPQLFNVLCGEMSLVGPRPSPFRENQICVPWRRARLSVRPGITGLWQICRHDRAEGDFHQWIAYDITYVRQMSLWLDLKIIIWTVLTLGGKRSVRVDLLIPGVVEPKPSISETRSISQSRSPIARHKDVSAGVSPGVGPDVAAKTVDSTYAV
jgi:lipopolysaccharide/colanic/teichoic acid biosynthesis glycosyltransferase